MSTIVTRAGKGSPLTHNEVDANFTNLNTDKLEVGAGFDAAVAATPAVTANTAKVTNATHTGDATGATALTLQPVAITGKTAVTAVGTDYVLISDTSDSGNLKKALASDFMGGGGGGGATGGSVTLDFGAAPGSSVAEAIITGQASILTGSRIRAWVQGSTADHNEYEHSRILPGRLGLGIADVVAATGFTICAETELRLTGEVAVNWEWA